MLLLLVFNKKKVCTHFIICLRVIWILSFSCLGNNRNLGVAKLDYSLRFREKWHNHLLLRCIQHYPHPQTTSCQEMPIFDNMVILILLLIDSRFIVTKEKKNQIFIIYSLSYHVAHINLIPSLQLLLIIKDHIRRDP